VSLADLLATLVSVAVLRALLLTASQRSKDGYVNRGGSDLPTSVVVFPFPPPNLALVLKEILQRGEVGSLVESLRVAIQQNLANTDKAKAKGLKAELEKALAEPMKVKL